MTVYARGLKPESPNRNVLRALIHPFSLGNCAKIVRYFPVFLFVEFTSGKKLRDRASSKFELVRGKSSKLSVEMTK